jgi:uncharacterized membrane protein
MKQLKLTKPNPAKDETTSKPISVYKNKAPPSATIASQTPRSKTISKDQSDSCHQSAHSLPLSVKGLNPYWDKQCEENNSKLWLPIKTALRGSGLNSYHFLSKKAVDGSWFSSKLIRPQRPNSQTSIDASSMSSTKGCTD